MVLALAGTMSNAQWSPGPGNLYMLTNGNVGIGTSSPTNTLHIIGIVNPATIRLENQTPLGYTQITMSDLAAGNTCDWRFKTATGGQFRIRDQSDARDVLIFERVTSGAPTSLYLNSSGDFGIGTVTPARKLEVSGMARVQLTQGGTKIVTANDFGDLYHGVTFPSNPNVYLNGDGAFTIPAVNDADWYETGTTHPPAAMGLNIYSTGNVGIGSTNLPSNKLHIFGPGTNDGMRITPTGATLTKRTGATIWLDGNKVGGAGRDFVIHTTGIDNTQAPGQLVFRDFCARTDVLTLDTRNMRPCGQATGGKAIVKVRGDFKVYGIPWTSNALWTTSDSTIKENIQSISNALGTIAGLQPRTFDYKVNEFPYLNLQAGNQFGFIAQEVDAVLSDLVQDFSISEEKDSLGNIVVPASAFKSLNYNGLIPVAIAGIQELDNTVTQLSAASIKKSCSLNVNYLTKSTGADLVCNSQIYDNGSCVGIGTSTLPSGYKLVVEGKLGARDVFVACVGWPDYVFGSAYQLKPLEEVEKYIAANKHLPGIPSANEIETEGGLNLGEMQKRQIEKIEELYKYIIEMNKNMQQLTIENKELKERVKAMENK